jgi:hypothetical protein
MATSLSIACSCIIDFISSSFLDLLQLTYDSLAICLRFLTDTKYFGHKPAKGAKPVTKVIEIFSFLDPNNYVLVTASRTGFNAMLNA